MKKIMMMLALMVTLSTSFAFAGETINKQVANAFRNEFAGATDVSWTAEKTYYKVTFTMDDQKLLAFYNTRGEFLAVTRFISSFELPHDLQSSLKKSYRNYWISDLFEMVTSDETGYFVTLENADSKVVLRSIDGSNWSLYLKSNKQ